MENYYQRLVIISKLEKDIKEYLGKVLFSDKNEREKFDKQHEEYINNQQSLVSKIKRLYENPYERTIKKVAEELKCIIPIIAIHSDITNIYSFDEEIKYLLAHEEISNKLKYVGFLERRLNVHYKSINKLLKHASNADKEIDNIRKKKNK